MNAFNLYQNWNVPIWDDAFEKIVCKMVAIFFRPQSVKLTENYTCWILSPLNSRCKLSAYQFVINIMKHISNSLHDAVVVIDVEDPKWAANLCY